MADPTDPRDPRDPGDPRDPREARDGSRPGVRPLGRDSPAPDPVEALADLESQAASWSREERAAEVADRAAEAYRSVTTASRLVAALGREVTFDLGPAGRVRGRLEGAGDGWAHIAEPAVLVLTGAAYAVHGLPDAAAAPAAWPLASRRSVAAVLARSAAGREEVQVTTRDGVRRRGRASRVGADFLELRDDDGLPLLLPTEALATVTSARSGGRA